MRSSPRTRRWRTGHRVLVTGTAIATLAALGIAPAGAAAQSGYNYEGDLLTRAQDQRTGPLPSSGTVYSSAGGEGNAPIIECKWELPDMRPDMAGVQYTSQDGSYDDDDLLFPTPFEPCGVAPGANAPEYVQSPEAPYNSIQVQPNVHDMPEERRVELWGAVSHAIHIDEITAVYWDIYEPYHIRGEEDGERLKTQVHGQRQPCSPKFEGALGAGYSTGQLDSRASSLQDASGLDSRCNEEEVAIYLGEFSISKHQPCGEYRVEMHAVSRDGAETIVNNWIDVICFHYLQTDFDRLDFGDLLAGTDTEPRENKLFGDHLMSTPDKPTIQNWGNSSMSVGIRFSKMLRYEGDQVVVPQKELVWFDAKFGSWDSWRSSDNSDEGILEDFPQIIATENTLAGDPNAQLTPFWFFDGVNDGDFGATGPSTATDVNMPHWPRGRTVCQNQTAKLDLSVHVPGGVLAGQQYRGDVEIVAYDSTRWGPDTAGGQLQPGAFGPMNDTPQLEGGGSPYLGTPTNPAYTNGGTEVHSLKYRSPFDPFNAGRCWSDTADVYDELNGISD